MFLDFHTHSLITGGSFSPQQLYDIAVRESNNEAGMLVITDADTISHYKVTASINRHEKNVIVLPGIEFSSSYNNIETHILGYNLPNDVNVRKLISMINHEKLTYFSKINRALLKYRVDLSKITDAEKILKGRLGELLVNQNLASSENEAQQTLMEWGGERKLVSVHDVIHIIRLCGGVAVLAHPCTTFLNNGFTIDQMDHIVSEMKVDGIEVYCHSASSEMINNLTNIAIERKLMITGGSGFYSTESQCSLGEYKKGVKLKYMMCQQFYEFLKEKHDSMSK